MLLTAALAALLLIAGCAADQAGQKTVRLSTTPEGVYEPQEIRVKAGTAVRIEGDPGMLAGPMDTLIIDGYGIRKRIAPGDNVVEFVADKPGTYNMYCANGMGNGKLIVT